MIGSEQMSNKSTITMLSDILIGFSKKIKIIVAVITVYFTILILYDIVLYKRESNDMIISYLSAIFIGVFVWFGVRFVFWLQIKNKSCPEQFLIVFSMTALIVFGISSVIMGIQYFTGGFIVAAFIAPVALVSLIKVQALRK